MAKITQGSWSEVRNPAWCGDFLDREHLLPGGAILSLSQFSAVAGVAVVASAAALAAATSISVDALEVAIPINTVLNFGGAKYAKLTAAAAAGATSLTVSALGVAIADNDVAYYNSLGTEVQLTSGILVGRTFAERATGDAFGPAAAADDEIFILAFDIEDLNNSVEVDLVRHGSLIKENYLPGWTTMAAGLQAKVRALYQTTRGVN